MEENERDLTSLDDSTVENVREIKDSFPRSLVETCRYTFAHLGSVYTLCTLHIDLPLLALLPHVCRRERHTRERGRKKSS